MASARSSRSNLSARSGGGSARSGGLSPAAAAALASGYPVDMSARTSYATPEPSARSSDFMSVYDCDWTAARFSSTGGEVGTVYEGVGSAGSSRPPRERKSRHYAAAMDAFAGPGPGGDADAGAMQPRQVAEIAAPVSEAKSVDPRHVFSSARHGKHKDVEASLVAGFDPHYQDGFGNTLFHVACQNGNKRIAKLAIKYGGDMDAQNSKGNTGLHFLFAYGYADIAEYFAEKGASTQIPNEVGKLYTEGIR